jgi:hypothetical protein
MHGLKMITLFKKILSSILIVLNITFLIGVTGCKSICNSHQIAYELVESTCQHPGYERYYCTKCDYEELKNHTPVLACKAGSETKVSVDSCTDRCIQNCIWCNKVLKDQLSKHHSTELCRELSGNPYYQCRYCDYHNYIDSKYTQINLTIETPIEIDYYNKIKIYADTYASTITLKFLNINPTEYFLYDIVFIFDTKEIHYKDYSMTFEFKNHNKYWFESYGITGYNKGLNLKDITLDTTITLRWLSFEAKVTTVKEIKFIFGDPLCNN